MNRTAVGVDIAKHVFQVHFIDQATGEIVNKPIKRTKFLEFFINRPPCLIGMEACGGAHHWARQLTKMGHQVRLMAGEYLRKLLIHGARSVLTHVKDPGPWIEQMKKRRPSNVVIVALANKMARTIWAVLAHEQPYQKDYVSVKPI